jgi:hypothetical protein
MQISDLRDDLQRRLAAFLWDQWAQMGILAGSAEEDNWAADPEALLLLSFEVGREEPRLFEEVLDWLAVNERLISVQRLRNLVRDEADRALVEAVLGWLGQRRRRARLEPKAGPAENIERPQALFRSSKLPVVEADPAFLAQGLMKPRSETSGSSRPPDLRKPINFAFRLRALLGIGVRAEVIRVLLTTEAPRVNAQVVAASTAYAKRNVQEALNSLRTAGALGSSELGNERRFDAPHERWARFLELDKLPRHEDWPQLFAAYRLILRWLADPANQDLSPYMLNSQARTMVEGVVADLQFAGVPIDAAGSNSASYLQEFAGKLRQLGPI